MPSPTTKLSRRTADVIVEDQGTVVLLTCQTPDAIHFVEEHVSIESWQWLGKWAFAVDRRYAPQLVTWLQDGGGLSVWFD